MKMTFVYATHGSGIDGGDAVFNGKVTDTSQDWSEWYNRNVHGNGIISPWPWVATGLFQIN
jgi:hypothetical protein